jgi:hypothetical protein
MLLKKNKMVTKMTKLDHTNRLCEIYVMGKQYIKFFLRRSSIAAQPLDLVHSDVYGLIKPTSIGGNMYFLTFRNDYNGKT